MTDMTTIGIDTSNYTTSAALYQQGEIVHSRKLLPVRDQALGLRQSDAVFAHIKQFPEVWSQLPISGKMIHAIGVSDRPCSFEGSYMPCFLVGKTIAETLAQTLNAKLYYFTHQQGHIAAALYSIGRLDLLQQSFLACHVSGGTTDFLLVTPDSERIMQIERIGGSEDLKAGQAVDRIGKRLGLAFPAGKALEQLACVSHADFRIHPSVQGMKISLSGLENKCDQLLKQQTAPEDVALFCLKYIAASLAKATHAAMEAYPGLPILFAGGVMSNLLIRKDLEFCKEALFAVPEFSSDNAAGAAVLAELASKR